MSFDRIELPGLVVADLYRQSLVVLEDVQSKAVKPKIKKISADIVDKPENGDALAVIVREANLNVQQDVLINTVSEDGKKGPAAIKEHANDILSEIDEDDNNAGFVSNSNHTNNIVEQETAKPPFKYLGGNKQQISILIYDPVHEYIEPGDLEFLEKMMAACKLTNGDMAVINIAHNQPAAQQLWQLMPAKAVLMFGVTTSAVGIPFYQPDFKVQHWDGGKFLNAPPLAAFRGVDTPELKVLKRELWEALRKVFFE